MKLTRDRQIDFGEAPQSTRGRASARVLALGTWFVAAFALPEAAIAISEGPQLAYVDPGAGSFVLQAVVAMFAGALVAGNVYWSRIKRFLGLGSDESSDDTNDLNSDRSDDS